MNDANVARRHDAPDPREAMLADVRDGFSRAQKELSPKYFYDPRGSALFERITGLPEYYLTRAEREILEREMQSLVRSLGIRSLVELGAGSAAKTRVILDAMRAAGSAESYVPIDISAEFLRETAQRLRGEYPRLSVSPVVGDISGPLALPRLQHPALFAFLGSTIGNFAPDDAVALLARIRAAMAPFDRLLLGVDLRKDVATIEAAYNDAAGVTAEFNRNVLRVLRDSLGATFDIDAFTHRATYDTTHHRIEMHLVSDCDQSVTIPGIGDVRFARGETIRTEISCKHDRASVDAMFAGAGLRVERWMTDAACRFALVVGYAR